MKCAWSTRNQYWVVWCFLLKTNCALACQLYLVTQSDFQFFVSSRGDTASGIPTTTLTTMKTACSPCLSVPSLPNSWEWRCIQKGRLSSFCCHWSFCTLVDRLGLWAFSHIFCSDCTASQGKSFLFSLIQTQNSRSPAEPIAMLFASSKGLLSHLFYPPCVWAASCLRASSAFVHWHR